MTFKDKLQFWIIVTFIIIGFLFEFAKFCKVQSIPCDQGDKCCLKARTTWWFAPTHDQSMYCPLHKMYHHSQRNCQVVRTAQAVEQENIRKREIELGYVEPPAVTVHRPERSVVPEKDRPKK